MPDHVPEDGDDDWELLAFEMNDLIVAGDLEEF